MSRPPGRGRGRGGPDRGGGAPHDQSPHRGAYGGGQSGGLEVYNDPNLATLEPNPEVTKIEDEYIKNSASIGGGLSGLQLGQTMPRRPDFGTQGKKIVVWTNYFEVKSSEKVRLFRYNIDVSEVGSARKLSKMRQKRLFELILEQPGFNRAITDFKSMVFTMTRIANTPLDIVITYRADGEDEPVENAPRYRVTVQETGDFLISELANDLKSTNPGAPEFEQREEIFQALNIVFSHYPQAAKDIIATVGQNRHFSVNIDRSKASPFLGGMEMLRGFFKSIRPATGRILLNVNVSHGLFYEPIALDAMMGKVLRMARNDLHIMDNNAAYTYLARYLKYVRVRRVHLPQRKNQAGKVIPGAVTIWSLANNNDGVTDDQFKPRVQRFGAGPQDVSFFLRNSVGSETGKWITVWDYFRKSYPSVQMSKDLPVVNVGTAQRPSYLPAEACLVIPGQPMKRKLFPSETSSMIDVARRRPHVNFKSIVEDGKAVLGLKPPNYATLASYGLSVSASLITVHARVLMPPNIKYSGKTVTPDKGSWNMRNITFAKGASINNWTVLWIQMGSNNGGFRDADELKRIIREFADFLRGSGVKMGPMTDPPPPLLLTPGQHDHDKKIQDMLRMMHDSPKKPSFILVILPTDSIPLYRKIKTVADTKAGFHTVCVVGSKFARGGPQYYANVGLKFNLKAGGINHTLDAPKLGIISEGKTMVVGLDVTHPNPGSHASAPSIAGIVASVDKELGQWPGDLRVQTGREEMVADLKDMFKSRLRLWAARNKNALPENIIVYRDGVSEGQFQVVLRDEVPLIRQACKEVYPPNVTKKGLPALAVIIVRKRHHTRFAPTTAGDADRSSNCGNGTVVDRGITQVRYWHFFLQAHTCLQGTARPASYWVILDEIFRKKKYPNTVHINAADALEDLTHNMCHLFGRATKAVSICPPAYYADLLCERARCYLSRFYDASNSDTNMANPTAEEVRISPNLRDTMFYI